jgi:uncharacterized protein (TIGR02246 family)
MPIQRPAEVLERVEQGINSGDVDVLLALYEPEACFNFEPGQGAITSIQPIRDALTGFLAMKPKITIEMISLNETGDIALIRDSWHLSGTASDGNPFDMSGQTAVVLRRQPDGNWLAVIDNPFSLGEPG